MIDAFCIVLLTIVHDYVVFQRFMNLLLALWISYGCLDAGTLNDCLLGVQCPHKFIITDLEDFFDHRLKGNGACALAKKLDLVDLIFV